MQPARGRFARFDLDRQIASTFPAHWKVGPAPVFYLHVIVTIILSGSPIVEFVSMSLLPSYYLVIL